MRSPLGIWDKTLWGKGYGREMLRRVMRYAFNEMGVDRMCAMGVKAGNARSRGLFKACGYRVVRELDDGEELDLEITREEYAAITHDSRPPAKGNDSDRPQDKW
jgi:RimJ/RimL family protein N-acetyltransferase